VSNGLRFVCGLIPLPILTHVPIDRSCIFRNSITTIGCLWYPGRRVYYSILQTRNPCPTSGYRYIMSTGSPSIEDSLKHLRYREYSVADLYTTGPVPFIISRPPSLCVHQFLNSASHCTPFLRFDNPRKTASALVHCGVGHSLFHALLPFGRTWNCLD
jgi:hypothetical protein